MKTPLAARLAALCFIRTRSKDITVERYPVRRILRVLRSGLALTVIASSANRKR